jgi:hypothetical protein
LAISLALTSCYGPFRLTRNLHEWNGSLGDEWINSLIFCGLLIVPVYEISLTIDAVVLNTIEFWTGDNPMALKKNQQIEKIVENENGTYQIIATRNHYTITAIDGPEKGKSIRLKIDSKNRSLWLEQNEKYIKIAEMDGKHSIVTLYHPDGQVTYKNIQARSPLAVSK